MEELHIKLKQPLHAALLADWRRLSIWRLLMRLPWTMGHDNIVRINLQLVQAARGANPPHHRAHVALLPVR